MEIEEEIEYAGDMKVDDYSYVENKLQKLKKSIRHDLNSIELDSYLYSAILNDEKKDTESLMKKYYSVSGSLNKHEGTLREIQEILKYKKAMILTNEYYKEKYSTVKEREQQQKIREQEAKLLESSVKTLIEELKLGQTMLKMLIYEPPRGEQQLMVKSMNDQNLKR